MHGALLARFDAAQELTRGAQGLRRRCDRPDELIGALLANVLVSTPRRS